RYILSSLIGVMKKLFISIILTAVSTSVLAQELNNEFLQGKWLIIKSGDYFTEDLGVGEDIWEFKNNTWTVNTSGKALHPEEFVIEGNILIIGNYQIKVVDHNSNMLLVDTSGIKQQLERIKKD
ncbi:hypothetical protein, partial [Parendozoicomonas sp. Alg238-R29]|uniref:hypothetical protein n=1 Tax=Parendozoicomonas sp. Alg238-R29 TaxID=2993446 RepID=UPI00248EBBDF